MAEVELLRDDVAMHDEAMAFTVARGAFNVSVGQSSLDEKALVATVDLCS